MNSYIYGILILFGIYTVSLFNIELLPFSDLKH